MRLSVCRGVLKLALVLTTLNTYARLQLPVHEPPLLPDLTMSPELRAFLAVEDLDNVLAARDAIKSVSAVDAAAIRVILKQWQNTQAVSNLLNHSDLIPEGIRLQNQERGLAESKENYYVVAAIVGLGNIDRAKLSPEERKRVATALQTIIRKTKDVRARQASVVLGAFVTTGDASNVIGLMEHGDETVRHNLRAWLLRAFGDDLVTPFTIAVRNSRLSEAAQRQLIAEFTEYVKNPRQTEQVVKRNYHHPYIPNLEEYKEEQR